MPALQNDTFRCDHLGASERDWQDIQDFSVKDPRGEGLAYYLRHMAFPDEEAGLMRTYLVREARGEELVGYFSLKAGLVSFNETTSEEGTAFDTLPGIELANIALSDGYVRRTPGLKGVGQIIFTRLIRPLVKDVSTRIGAKALYIFALPFDGLIRRYEHYGFRRLESAHEADVHRRLKPRYDDECIFMYQML